MAGDFLKAEQAAPCLCRVDDADFVGDPFVCSVTIMFCMVAISAGLPLL